MFWNSSVKDLRQFSSVKPKEHLERSIQAHDHFPEQLGNGYQITENFLSEEMLDIVRSNFNTGSATLNKQPSSMVTHDRILKEIGNAVSISISDHSDRFWSEIRNNTFYQKVINHPVDNDIQKVFHMDTFFPAWKFWYFPYEVTSEDGPFRYVPGSHILDNKKQDWMLEQYRKFYDGEELNEYSKEGSLRITEDEIMSLYETILDVTVPANTLVITNVFGFHARGNVNNASVRVAIHGSIRYDNPFN